MRDPVMTMVGQHTAAAAVSVLLFIALMVLIFRRSGWSPAARLVEGVTDISVLATAFLLARTYLSTFGFGSAVAVCLVWLITYRFSCWFLIVRKMGGRPSV